MSAKLLLIGNAFREMKKIKKRLTVYPRSYTFLIKVGFIATAEVDKSHVYYFLKILHKYIMQDYMYFGMDDTRLYFHLLFGVHC